MHSSSAILNTFLLFGLCLVSAAQEKTKQNSLTRSYERLLEKRLSPIDEQRIADKDTEKDLDLLNTQKHRLNKLDRLQHILRGTHRNRRSFDMLGPFPIVTMGTKGKRFNTQYVTLYLVGYVLN